MGWKKGRNEEKPPTATVSKQGQATVDVAQSGSSESSSAEPVLKDSTSTKQKQKKRKKGDEEHCDSSKVPKSADTCSMSHASVTETELKDQPLVPSEQSVTGSDEGECFELTIPHRKTRSGTKGCPIQIETNHLALNFRKLDRAVHYDVAISPSSSKKLFHRVMEEFRKVYYSERHPAFDGTKNLYSSSELPFGLKINKDVTIYKDGKPRQYEVVVKFANFVDFTSLGKFMTTNPNGIHHMVMPQEAIRCLDIVLRSAPALAYSPVGRSYFTPPKEQIISVDNDTEMYCRFYESAIMGWKPFLNIDVAHTVFTKWQNVIDLILDICKLRREDLQKPLYKNQKDDIDNFLRTLKVRYEVPGILESRRCYRVNGLDRSATEATFQLIRESETTVEKYFFKHKNIVLKYPHMPCLWVGNKDRVPRILVPAEFCSVIEHQVVKSEKLTISMDKQAATSTKDRKENIMSFVRKAHFNENPCVREFGITVGEEFVEINAHVLEPPALTYNETVVKPTQGAWCPEKFLYGVTLKQWTIVNLDPGIPMKRLENMVQLMCAEAASLGMTISQPQRPFQMLQLCHGKELQELERVFKKKKDLQLIVVVIPNDGCLYSYVKQVAELIVGCLTQCIRNITVCKMDVRIIINILQKVNAKLEGTNHILNNRMEWMTRPYMIMSAYVTHPSPGSKDKPSVAAVTASCDAEAFKYNVCWRLQLPKVQIIEELEDITREHLLYFYTSMKFKPEKIIFFRDGVSETQFQYILNAELPAIRRACSSLQPDGTYKPKITFLVVQKRHHTCFFPVNSQDASKDNHLNVPVGTCVDTEITHPTVRDFYLLSHASTGNVARPTKYRVLWDDADMSEDDLEQLTFYFCHMYARSTNSVRYPVPTYYAHLAATRIMAYCETRKFNMNNLAQEQDRLSIKKNIIKDRPMFFV